MEALESSSSLHSSQDANDNQNGANEEEITSTVIVQYQPTHQAITR